MTEGEGDTTSAVARGYPFDLYAYTRWANERVLDAVDALTDEAFTRDVGGSFGSVQATLAHMLGADWVWLRRWKGESPSVLPAEWDLTTFAGLRERWREVEHEQAEFVDALGPGDLDRVIEHRNMAGTPFANRLDHLLRHVVNHATYHRGQVVTLLRQLGAEAPATDLVRFYREAG
jgi:uncharacterized damage-inducible protein DinB